MALISDKKRFLINFVLGLIFAFSTIYYYETLINFSAYPKSGDLIKFYMSTKYFWEGKDIYTPIPTNVSESLIDKTIEKSNKVEVKASQPHSEILHPNLNPPFQTLLFAPLGLISYKKAYLYFSLLSFLVGLVAVIMIYNEEARTEQKLTGLLSFMIIILYYFPTWTNLIYGQFSFIVLLLITLAWISARKGRDKICGISLGLAMSLKIFIGLFILFFLVRRRWRLVFWFVGTFLLLSLLPLLIFGVDAYKSYLSILSSITWYSASWNASFMGFFTRIFGGSENVPLVNRPEVALALTRICSLIFTAWLVWLAWPRAQESSLDRFDLGFSLTIVGMLLISPLGWMYYFTLLIIPAAVAWRMVRGLDSHIWYQIIIVLAWILSTIPHYFIPSVGMNTPLLWFTWAGFYFYALLLFSFTLGSLAQRLQKTSAPDNLPLSGPTQD